MAFLAMLWQSDTENRVLLALLPFTWMRLWGVRYGFQSRAFTPSNRASKVVASKEPTSSSSRSAVRKYRRARAMSS